MNKDSLLDIYQSIEDALNAIKFVREAIDDEECENKSDLYMITSCVDNVESRVEGIKEELRDYHLELKESIEEVLRHE